MRLSKPVSRFVFILLLPLLGVLSSATASAQSSDPALTEAQRLLKQGQYSQALTKVDSHIGSKPRDPQGRFLKGLILTEMKRTQDAIQVFKKLTEDFPELPEPYNNLAVLYAQEKQYEKARQALEAAIKTHPAYAVAHENLGDIYAKLASQAYGKALQIDAGNTTAQTKMAMIRDLVPASTVAAAGKPATRPSSEPIRIATADQTKVSPLPPNASVPAAAVVAPPPPPAPPPVKVAAAPVTAPSPTPAPAAVSAPVTLPAAAAPTPAPAPAAAATKPAAASPADVSKAVQAWAHAWSQKDVRAYLAAYAADFQTPNGMPRKTWEQEREARISKPGKIDVQAEKISVELNGNDKATVKFRQNYRSANLNSSATKTLVMVRSGGRWLIQQERVN